MSNLRHKIIRKELGVTSIIKDIEEKQQSYFAHLCRIDKNRYNKNIEQTKVQAKRDKKDQQ